MIRANYKDGCAAGVAECWSELPDGEYVAVVASEHKFPVTTSAEYQKVVNTARVWRAGLRIEDNKGNIVINTGF